MKLCIRTQIEENYGVHDWDGKGAVPQYWKFKGGNVYVVEHLTECNIRKIDEHGIPTLERLISHSSDGYMESIVWWDIVNDDHEVCEGWESPYMLEWDGRDWISTKTDKNDGCFVSEIQSKHISYRMLDGGERADYICNYLMVDGVEVSSERVESYILSMRKMYGIAA